MFNLNGTLLRVVTRLNNAYAYDVEVERRKLANSNKYSFEIKGGFAANVLLELSKYLNFSYLLLDDPSLTYSFQMASNLSIDIFAASFSLTEERGNTVDPTFVMGISKVQVFFNREFELTMNDLILHPFHPNVWLFTGLLILIFSLSIIISTTTATPQEKITRSDGAFQILAVCFQQDCRIIFDATSSKTIAWTTSITFLLLLAAYSGTVVSLNTVKKYSLNSFEKIVGSKFDINFDVGFNNGSAYQVAAEALNTTPVMGRFFKKVRKSSFKFKNFDESFKLVDGKPLAYIIDEETGYSAVEKRLGFFPCEYGRISFAQVKYPWVMFMRKGSEFRPAINYGLQKLKETGHLRYFIKRWIPGTRCVACSSKNKEFYLSIQLTQLRSLFILLVVGAALALSVFLLELFVKRKNSTGLVARLLKLKPTVYTVTA